MVHLSSGDRRKKNKGSSNPKPDFEARLSVQSVSVPVVIDPGLLQFLTLLLPGSILYSDGGKGDINKGINRGRADSTQVVVNKKEASKPTATSRSHHATARSHLVHYREQVGTGGGFGVKRRNQKAQYPSRNFRTGDHATGFLSSIDRR